MLGTPKTESFIKTTVIYKIQCHIFHLPPNPILTIHVLYMHSHVYAHTLHMHAHVHIHIYIHTHTYTYTSICIHTCTGRHTFSLSFAPPPPPPPPYFLLVVVAMKNKSHLSKSDWKLLMIVILDCKVHILRLQTIRNKEGFPQCRLAGCC